VQLNRRKVPPGVSRRGRFGGSSIEYLTILALVVLPLVVMMNTTILQMFWTGPTPERNKSTIIPMYEHRVRTAITWPVG
jgi:hypothetical protein